MSETRGTADDRAGKADTPLVGPAAPPHQARRGHRRHGLAGAGGPASVRGQCGPPHRHRAARRLTVHPARLGSLLLTHLLDSGHLGRGQLALRSAPPRLDRESSPPSSSRPVAVPVATGVGAFCIFSLGALVVRRIPLLDRAVNGALVFAERGRGPWVLLTTCANGIGEEVFFRGAMYAALPGTHPVLSSTAVYTLTTTATRNPALILAAGVMGTLFGYQRRATHGLQAPLLTHLTWSTLMVTLLPRIARRAEARSRRAS